jgi:hypothetical protein
MSLLLLLFLADRFGQLPSVSDVRWALYSAHDPSGRPLNLPEDLRQTAGKWQAYQANELGHIALEALLKLVIVTLPPGQAGQPVAETVGSCVAQLLAALSQDYCSWREFRESVALSPNAAQAGDEGTELVQVEYVFNRDPAESAAAGLQLLAILDQRWPNKKHPLGSVFGPGSTYHARFGERTIMGVLDYLRKNEESPLENMIAQLTKRFVIDRHLSVAMQKLRHQGNRTFLFELMDGNIAPSAESGPVFTNPRLEPSLTFLNDLHLANGSGLTKRGREVLATT